MSEAAEPNPGILLATELVKELVLLRQELVLMRQDLALTRKVMVQVGEASDQLARYFDTMSYTVEYMNATGHKPNWNDFLDCWAQAEHEVFGDDQGEDEDGQGGEEPSSPPNGGDNPARKTRKPLFS